MVKRVDGWKCVEHTEGGKVVRGCGRTDINGKWRVEFYPTIPTFNKKGTVRHNQLTLETWPDQKSAEDRVDDLKIHFRGVKVVPTQQTSLSAQQCRAAEEFFKKRSIHHLEFSQRVLAALETSPVKSPEEIVSFIAAHATCGIPCTPVGVVNYSVTTHWYGDLRPRPDIVKAFKKVLDHKKGGYGGSRPISKERESGLKSKMSYILGWFVPNYPESPYPEVMTDDAIKEFVTYSYDTPREGMPKTEIQKWQEACAQAEKEGKPLPPKPVEKPVYKLVQDGTDKHGVAKYKRVPGEMKYKRPWPRTVMNDMLTECRAIKNAMALPKLCDEPAGWVGSAGPDLKEYSGSKAQLAAEAIARAKERRVLTTAEKHRILDASLEIDGGRGAASVLWQGWGGGRREDVKKYCEDNLQRADGKIRVDRWQNKNGSCKDVTAMPSFYVNADFLIKTGKWTDDNFANGFSDTTRMRILARAGFWEESWEYALTIEDSRACEDFAYQPVEPDDLMDLPQLVSQLRDQSGPAAAFVWNGFSDPDKETLRNYRSSDKGQEAIRNLITSRFNEIMDGPNFHTPQLFEGVVLRDRTVDLLQRNPTGPNLKYLNRLLLEDIFPNELATRQNYPPNALRRSGMSAYFQVDESVEKTIAYFSTGGVSWEQAYKTAYGKKGAREHWQMLYSFMDKAYSEADRKELLPPGHKLDDFRTPAVIESEQKNAVLAEEYKQATPPAAPRKGASSKPRTMYTDEEKAKYVAEFQESDLDQKAFAEANGLVFGVFHRWLEKAGLTRRVRTQEEIDKIVADFHESGMTQVAYVEKTGVSQKTLTDYLKKAGQTRPSPRHTPKEIAQFIQRFKCSDMSPPEFAKSIKVDPTTFRKWLAKAEADKNEGKNEEPSDIRPGRKHTDEQVAKILADYEPGKMTIEAYAKSQGVNPGTFVSWLAEAGKTEPRRSKEQISAYLEQFRKSGMSAFSFSKFIGVCLGTLYRWLKEEEANQE